MIDFEPTCQAPRWQHAEDYALDIWDQRVEGNIPTKDKRILQEINDHMETDDYINELTTLFNKSTTFFDGVTARLISTLFAWEQILYEKERWDTVDPSDKPACERFLNGRRLSSDTEQDVKKRNTASLIMLKVVAPRVYGPCIASIGALSVTAGRFKKQIAKCEVTKEMMSTAIVSSKPKFADPFASLRGPPSKAQEPKPKPELADPFGFNKPRPFPQAQESKPELVKNAFLKRKRAEESEDDSSNTVSKTATYRQRGKSAAPRNRSVKSPVSSDTLEESEGGGSSESESTSASRYGKHAFKPGFAQNMSTQKNEVNESRDELIKMKLVRARQHGKESAQRNRSEDTSGVRAYQTSAKDLDISDGVRGKWLKKSANKPGESAQGRPGKLRKKETKNGDKERRKLPRNLVKDEDDEESESDGSDSSDGGAKLLPHPAGSKESEHSDGSDEGSGLQTSGSGESSELSGSDEFDRAKVKEKSLEGEDMDQSVHDASISARRPQSGRKRQRPHVDNNGPAKRQKSVSFKESEQGIQGLRKRKRE